MEQVLEKLTVTERRQKRYAGILYAISAVMLLLTMGIAVVFISRTDFANASLEKTLAVGVVYLFLAILVVSLSKFLFTLAKSFMVEAIRCSDRIHAISFGKFYIEAFEEKGRSSAPGISTTALRPSGIRPARITIPSSMSCSAC